MPLFCPICNGAESASVAATHVSPLNDQTYTLRSCLNCGIQYWTPRVILPEFYSGEVFGSYVSQHLAAGRLQPWHRPFFEAPPPVGRILDVGCGAGAFLAATRTLGFEAWGTDLDRRSVEQARNRRGLENVHALTLDEFVDRYCSQGLRFDVISFFEVLEHQDDPRHFLQKARSILRPGGRIVGSVPNRDRWAADRDRATEACHGDFPPHHFFWFSERSLQFLLRRELLQEVQISRSAATLMEVSAWLEANLLGSISGQVKRRLKAGLMGERMKHLGVTQMNVGDHPLRAAMLSALRRARDLAFLPIAAAIRGSYNRRGAHLYFTGRRAVE